MIRAVRERGMDGVICGHIHSAAIRAARRRDLHQLRRLGRFLHRHRRASRRQAGVDALETEPMAQTAELQKRRPEAFIQPRDGKAPLCRDWVQAAAGGEAREGSPTRHRRRTSAGADQGHRRTSCACTGRWPGAKAAAGAPDPRAVARRLPQIAVGRLAE
ncbi:MAG: hypothetical protein MZW92_47690 [Comamonadaceae bacterium]|nr:hypothetical protein [Comamonadaceae bacterium]